MDLTNEESKVYDFLSDGPKGRDDFWEAEEFYDPIKERGVFPRKVITNLNNKNIIEKFKKNRRIYYRIVEQKEEETLEKKGFFKRLLGK